MEILRTVLRTVTNGKVAGEEASFIRTEALDGLVARKHPDELAGSLLSLETGSVWLPNSDDMRELMASVGSFVDVEVSFYCTGKRKAEENFDELMF